jgi:hypothetical protein
LPFSVPIDANDRSYRTRNATIMKKRDFAVTCSNPHSRPALPPLTNAAPNYKGGYTSVKVTTSYFNYGQVGQFTKRCPDQHQLSAPTQSIQNMARTLTYRKCYNYRQKGHFANVCPNPRYRLDVTTVATSTPYRQVNSTTSTIQQQY